MCVKKISQMTAFGVLMLTAVAIGQRQPTTAALSQQIPLKVEVVFKEFDGGKQVSRLPYMLPVMISRQNGESKLRMQLGLSAANELAVPLGTEIDCEAEPLREGLFDLSLTVFRAYVSQPKSTEPHESIFRSFRASYHLLMRDGQTIESAMATDPVSGRVLKVDVTLHVVK